MRYPWFESVLEVCRSEDRETLVPSCQLLGAPPRQPSGGLYVSCALNQPLSRASQVVLVVKNLPANAGDTGDVRSLLTQGSNLSLRWPGAGRQILSSGAAWEALANRETRKWENMKLRLFIHQLSTCEVSLGWLKVTSPFKVACSPRLSSLSSSNPHPLSFSPIAASPGFY